MSWKPEVVADRGGDWCGNALRFATKEEAEKNARDLMSRWMLVQKWRVVESDDPVNYQWDDNLGLIELTGEPPAPPYVAEAAPTTGNTKVGPPR